MDGLMYGGLFAVAMLAGFIDAIAGGGGLLTIPALLSVGLSPSASLATNKVQAVGSALSASVFFVRKKVIDPFELKWVLLWVFIGSAVGAVAVQNMDNSVLRKILPFLILLIGLYFLFSPKLGATTGKKRLGYLAFAVCVACPIGFYDGFFGPGTGSFFCLAGILFWGLNLTHATAHAKVFNLVSNTGALIFFAVGGEIAWKIGLVMLLGQLIGAQLGARLVLRSGQKLIRPMVVLVSFAMVIKLWW